VWQSFLSIFPHLSGGTMATSQTCCHLPGELLNSAAECADRARIRVDGPLCRSLSLPPLAMYTGLPPPNAWLFIGVTFMGVLSTQNCLETLHVTRGKRFLKKIDCFVLIYLACHPPTPLVGPISASRFRGGLRLRFL
jgi:hypothetical protein